MSLIAAAKRLVCSGIQRVAQFSSRFLDCVVMIKGEELVGMRS
jgi:hypothetical protein